ncbi:MAG: hypothetical protein R2883_04310 [Caldisericia bacterium]
MDKIDDILDDVESGKTSPEDGARRIKEDRNHGHCCGHGRVHGGIHMRGKSSQFFGIYLVLQGLVILGSAVFGWFPAAGSWWNLVWPVIIGVIGIGQLVKAGKKGRFSFLGVILLALGATRIVVNTGVIAMTTWWAWFWPACLIAAGVAIIAKSMRNRNEGGICFDWNNFDWNE